MNDLEYIKTALAQANLRYSLTVMPEGTTVIIQGRRDQSPMKHGTVELQFGPEGNLLGAEGRE